MNSFFIEYRDPLFSIIIFFVIIFMIAFFSYWWNKYRFNRDTECLTNFLNQFSTSTSQSELYTLTSSGELSEGSWLLLANFYYKNGDYEKSIEIYNELLKICTYKNRLDIMNLLGTTYFKAGFLERSKQIFLEILKTMPRNQEVLNYLLLVYEYMRDYESALEVLEPLEELGSDVTLDRAYLEILALLCEPKYSIQEKTTFLLASYKKHHQLSYMIFEYLFRVNPVLAWEHLDSSKSELLSDIFWRIDEKDLNLDIISKNGYLRELFSARGDIDLAKGSSLFELDVLIKLQNKANATLNFEYICENCKRRYPFAFNRCASCHKLDTNRVEWSLVKNYHQNVGEEHNSFQ